MRSAATIILIRSASEIDRAHHIPGKALYLCTRRDVLDLCRERGLDVRLLSEDLLEGGQPDINDWGYRFSIDLVARLKKENDPKLNFFLEANFYLIKGILVQTAKFILTLESFLKGQDVGKFYLPQHSDSLLTYTCRTYLALHRPDIQVIDFPGSDPTSSAQNPARWTERLRKMMIVISNAQAFFMLRLRSQKERKILFVSGGLNHLLPVVLALKEKSPLYPVFIEHEFHFSKYLVCLRKLIPHIVLPGDKTRSNPLLAHGSNLELGRIVFRGVDYSAVFEKVFAFGLKAGVARFAFDHDFFSKLFHEFRPGGVLLDEDLSLQRRSLAVLAWQVGCPSFVISHGVPVAHNTNEAPKQKFCGSSLTFVNSELEKAAYITNLFFDPSKVTILGTPRHDEIFKMETHAGKLRTQRGKKVVLLCLSQFESLDFELIISVTIGTDSDKEKNKAYIKDLLEILSGREDVLVKIKPHFDSCQKDVENYVKSLDSKANYRIESYRSEIFELEREADLIVTPESTVITEAVMFKKPVIVMNYGPLGLSTPYENTGLVMRACDKDQLRESVTKVLDGDRFSEKLFSGHPESVSYFSKYRDGRNTQRVSDCIAQHVERK